MFPSTLSRKYRHGKCMINVAGIWRIFIWHSAGVFNFDD